MQSAATSPLAEENPSRASPYVSAGAREIIQSAAEQIEKNPEYGQLRGDHLAILA